MAVDFIGSTFFLQQILQKKANQDITLIQQTWCAQVKHCYLPGKALLFAR